ncbi:hypothetical protein [Bacillus sp. KH172YL63]|uniref:hypothetical protein n=1 Tax=Bacillus sp. KH172YL63 TaxID=2709784 RepID=UPI0013E4CCDB|nr:hypothetical protein [Bacillus sp. KH172YL63]BCB02182.1 hypothetical protein KH172YL63_03150 [Bacillus sp. KH172YL63]
MIEMQGGEDLRYTNQLPDYALRFHRGLITVFGVASLGLLWLVFYFLVLDFIPVLAGLMFFVFALLAFLTKFCYNNLKLYTNLTIVKHLNHEGYYFYYRNEKTKEEIEELITYEQMDQVIIGHTLRYIPNTSTAVKSLRIIGARIIIVWENEGEMDFRIFDIEVQDQLDGWIDRLRLHDIPLYMTEKDIGSVPGDEYVKKFLGEGRDLKELSTPFTVGGRTTEKLEKY